MDGTSVLFAVDKGPVGGQDPDDGNTYDGGFGLAGGRHWLELARSGGRLAVPVAGRVWLLLGPREQPTPVAAADPVAQDRTVQPLAMRASGTPGDST